MIDLNELERLAKAATQGEWSAKLGAEENEDHGEFWLVAKTERLTLGLGQTIFDGTDINSRANAAHIGAASPPVVLELIAEIKRLREAEKLVCDFIGAALTNDVERAADATKRMTNYALDTVSKSGAPA